MTKYTMTEERMAEAKRRLDAGAKLEDVLESTWLLGYQGGHLAGYIEALDWASERLDFAQDKIKIERG